jgi:hypothetical protein
MPLFGHHTEGFLQIEIMGQPFPTGPMEHAIAFGVSGIVVLLVVYGGFAAARDFLRWRQRRERRSVQGC